MITYKQATESQYEDFLNLMLEQMADYIEILMQLMGMSIEEFRHLLKTVGQVYSINRNDNITGFYWIEGRGEELHLHGLIIKEKHQGEGIGTQTLKMLEEEYESDKEYIELGVHQTNERAINLYQKLGYRIVATKEDLGFHIMRKTLQ
jgi:ribosomal protein S18 acetylase RimI-like enzyme